MSARCLTPNGPKIYANLNFDMIGSPNYVRFVYDGDGSDGGRQRPSRFVRHRKGASTDYFDSQGACLRDRLTFDGRSDYGPFIAAGIPAGGLFSGAEGVKTPEQAAVMAVQLVRRMTAATTRRATPSTT